MNNKRLIDIFPQWSTGAIFSRLGEKYSDLFPWASVTQDMDYFLAHSGGKIPSPMLDRLLDSAGVTEATSTIIDSLADIIKSRYAVNWQKLYAIMSVEYNPIQNYDMSEKETPDITRTETPDITRTRKSSQSADVNITSSGNTSADVYGFNSNSPVPQSDTNGETSQRTQGSPDNNYTDVNETESGTRLETETGTRTLTRSGNIGVTTSQQMLESEIALWQWNFLNTVYSDVDKLLASPVYCI